MTLQISNSNEASSPLLKNNDSQRKLSPIDQCLQEAVKKFDEKEINWHWVAKQVGNGYNVSKCKQTWAKLNRPSGAWSDEEDAQLIGLIHKHGESHWSAIAQEMNNGRTSIQCSSRWKKLKGKLAQITQQKTKKRAHEESEDERSLKKAKTRVAPIQPSQEIAPTRKVTSLHFNSLGKITIIATI
jgi:hypothetical protein